MNKKFSTLAVAAMLASAFTVNADPGDFVTKLAEGDNGNQYQLVELADSNTDVDRVLVLVKDNDGNAYLRLKPVNKAYDLGSSLWCVNVTVENQGKNPIFDFINKAQQLVLDVTAGGYDNWTNGINPDEAFVGGEVAGWEFAPILGADDNPMFSTNKVYSLRSYINSNEVATLVEVEDNGKKEIRVAVYPANAAVPAKDSIQS